MKKRILITPASTVLAHAGRCLVLARELKRRGHDVILAGSPRYLSDPHVAGEPFDFHLLPDFDAAEGLTFLRTLRRRPSSRLLREHIEAECQLIDRVSPDAVIIDFRLTMYLSAERRRVPRISLVGGRWMYPLARHPYSAFRTYPLARAIEHLMGRRGADWFIPRLVQAVLWYKMSPYRELMRWVGLPVRRHLWDLLTGELTLILDSERLAPLMSLPPHVIRVGPLNWSPSGSLPAWVEKRTSDRPLIYISLGSTGHPALFHALISLFTNRDFDVILTTGGQITIETERLPANVRVERFLPGEEVMRRADIVICHGGAGTIYQAISAATPLIAVATHFEQELLAQEIERAGAGLLLSLGDVLTRPDRVIEAVQHILKNREDYRARMRELQADQAGADPVQRAADAIESFLGIGCARMVSSTAWSAVSE